MLECRIQTCVDANTYEALKSYMDDNDIEKVSTALRKIVSNFLRENSYDSRSG